MNDISDIHHDSGNVEWFTPVEIIEAARATMGTIDLDPFSCAEANKAVRASAYFTKETNGLRFQWCGHVWMNHPYSKVMNRLCISKAVEEFTSGRVTQLCCITYASTTERWFRPLMQFPQCFFHKRTAFREPGGRIVKGATKGCAVTYMGRHLDRFAANFAPFGTIKVPYLTARDFV